MPRILAFGVVLIVDWHKPCDTPLKSVVLVIMMLDIIKLKVHQQQCYVDGVLVPPASIQGRKLQYTIELCHMLTFIWGVSCLFKVAPNRKQLLMFCQKQFLMLQLSLSLQLMLCLSSCLMQLT